MEQQFIYLEMEGIHYKLPYSSVLFVKSVGEYCEVYTSTMIFFLYSSLSTLLLDAPGNELIQCHRSYAINPKMIKNITKEYIELMEFVLPIEPGFNKSLQHYFRNSN